MKTSLFSSGLVYIFFCLTACSEFVDIDKPVTELTTPSVFADDATAEAAMLGLYVRANTSGSFLADGHYDSDVAYIAGKSADEIKEDADINGIQLAHNELLPTNTRVTRIWTGAYKIIYQANAILEGISSTTGMSTAKRHQLEGEARLMRAFTYFYLVNLFGDVPLITTTDYRVNSVMERTSAESVYEQIQNDLTIAREFLPNDFSAWNNERIRPVKAAASALLARVALYRQQWANAEMFATEVIMLSPLFQLEPDLNSLFLKNNKEAIWQFYPIRAGRNSNHGNVVSTFRFYVQLTEQLVAAFEPGDKRNTTWIITQNLSAGGNYKYARKYKANASTTPVEYTTNLRLSEQYLIRAEARIQQNNLPDALTDINVIRNRAGLPDAAANSQADAFAILQQERRLEFLVEYGHRWLDLKRWNMATQVLSPIKPLWQITDEWYPIPASDRSLNNNLTQNSGYPEN